MKNILLAAFVLLFAACGVDRSDPEKVAEKYLNALFRYEYEEAAKYSMAMNRSQLEMALEGMKAEGVTPAQLRAENGEVTVHIHDSMVAGGNAYVSYSISVSNEDATDQREVLVLSLQEGEWQVAY